MAIILRYFTEIGTFGANYVKVVEVIPIMSEKNIAQRMQFSKCVIYGDILRGY